MHSISFSAIFFLTFAVSDATFTEGMANPNCRLGLEVDTDTVYHYQFLGNPVGKEGRIEFEVKAEHDVYIALSPSITSTELYEILIGGWHNTKSAIRRCAQCVERVEVSTVGYLNGDQFERFWITYGDNGTIAVGRDDETAPFMVWTDPQQTFEINYLGYSTGFGSSGTFRFCSLG